MSGRRIYPTVRETLSRSIIPQTRTQSTSSVNPTEVSHFNALAAQWWNPHGSSRLLHLMNPLRHDFINSCLSAYPPTKRRRLRYLDVGCGGGIFAESAARLPHTESVTAIDPTPGVLKVAQDHARKDPLLHNTGRLVYKETSIEGLPEPESEDEAFDVLSLFEVIEHIDKPAPFLEQCLAHVRPGGWIIMSTIARTWTSWFTTKVVAEDMLNIVPRGTHDWNKYINEHELRAFFDKQVGWGGNGPAVRVQGVAYIPGLGWKVVPNGEQFGNYFFGVRRNG